MIASPETILEAAILSYLQTDGYLLTMPGYLSSDPNSTERPCIACQVVRGREVEFYSGVYEFSVSIILSLLSDETPQMFMQDAQRRIKLLISDPDAAQYIQAQRGGILIYGVTYQGSDEPPQYTERHVNLDTRFNMVACEMPT